MTVNHINRTTVKPLKLSLKADVKPTNDMDYLCLQVTTVMRNQHGPSALASYKINSSFGLKIYL